MDSEQRTAQQSLPGDAPRSVFIQGVLGALRLSLGEDSVGAAEAGGVKIGLR